MILFASGWMDDIIVYVWWKCPLNETDSLEIDSLNCCVDSLVNPYLCSASGHHSPLKSRLNSASTLVSRCFRPQQQHMKPPTDTLIATNPIDLLWIIIYSHQMCIDRAKATNDRPSLEFTKMVIHAKYLPVVSVQPPVTLQNQIWFWYSCKYYV